MDTPEKKPKKRGRKPKNKIVEKKKDNISITEKMIVRLNNTKKSEIDTIKPYTSDDILSNIDKNKNEQKCSKVCWNCCHDFHDLIYGIPLKYYDKVFYIYGYFCCLECGIRYVFDNLKDHDFNEILSYTNLFNNIIYKKTSNIIMPPNRLVLEYFGGDKTIDEYRNNDNNNIYDIIMPPILPINHKINSYETNNSELNKKSNLKLYRKKPLENESKNITKSMQLVIK